MLINDSRKQYKNMLNQWNMRKYLKRDDVRAINQIVKRRQFDNKPTEVLMNGKIVNQVTLDRLNRAPGPEPTAIPIDDQCPLPPPGIVLRTPQVAPQRPESPPGMMLAPLSGLSAEQHGVEGLPLLTAYEDNMMNYPSFTVQPLEDRTGRQPNMFPPERSSTMIPTLADSQGSVPWSGSVTGDSARIGPLGLTECPSQITIPGPPRLTKDICLSQPVLSRPTMVGLLKCSMRPALLLSKRNRPGRTTLELPETTDGFDPDILFRMVDLLGWLQLSSGVIQLGLLYLVQVYTLIPEAKTNPWTEMLVCLRFAQMFLSDDTWSIDFWKSALKWCASDEPFSYFCGLERSLLAHESFRIFVSETDYARHGAGVDAFGASALQTIATASMLGSGHTLTALEKAPEESSLKSAWEHHKDTIRQLYRFHTLEDVARIMETEHGFRASIRAYRQRLADWGAKKRDMEDSSKSGEHHTALKIVPWRSHTF